MLGFTLAAVGLASIWLTIPAWVLVAGAAISVLLILIEIRNNILESRQTEFLPRDSDSFADVLEKLPGDGVRVLEIPSGIFLHYSRASALMKEHDPIVELARSGYVVPAELQPHAKRFLKHVLSNPVRFGRRFNGPCLGWNTDPAGDSWQQDTIEVVQGRYFDLIQTDEFATFDVAVGGHSVPGFGRDLFIDRHGRLRDLHTSWLFNVIGASTLAITNDGQLVKTEQTDDNSASQGLLAPSGSGAAEPRDLVPQRLTLSEFAANAAQRELCEEANLEPETISHTCFLGFGRWLQRAGRGELICISFLNVDSDTVNRRAVRSSERVYTRRARCVRFALPMANWTPDDPAQMLPLQDRSRMSLPLAAALSMLADETRRPDSKIRRSLQRCGVV